MVSGPIAPPMVEDIDRLVDEIVAYETVIFDLNSPGGELSYTEKFATLLQSIRKHKKLKTYVRHGSRCLSGCVLLFQQGEERIAGGASSWLFHGACPKSSSVLLPKQTKRFIDLMAASGVSRKFLSSLVDKGYLSVPGEYWLSGYELFNVHNANIITRLIAPWRPLKPAFK